MNPKNLALAVQLRHELHQLAEPSMHEVKTKARLMNFLSSHTKLRIVDRGRWFYGVYDSPVGRRNIAFRADFDAVAMAETIELAYASFTPEYSHKCGHDGHSACLAGFALEIDQIGSDNNIYFLFQHAEETGQGAKEARVLLEEEQIEEIFAYHNFSGLARGSIGIINGIAHPASKGMTIRMTGSPAHASNPAAGHNPALALASLITRLPEFLEPSQYRSLVLATVVGVDIGDKAFGVAAAQGELMLTLRAHYEDELDQLQDKLTKLADELARRDGLRVSYDYADEFPETFNHTASADKVRRAARQLGFELVEFDQPGKASEDFGHYTKQVPGAIFRIGNGPDHPQVHTFSYDFPDDIIATAVAMFKALSQLDDGPA